MKCIVADDEYLVRFSIKDMLIELAQTNNSLFDTIVEAKDGKELLTLVDQLQPELVFVDIKMPHLHGLDAMEKGKELSGHTQWVILTGYAEFDYARRALSLGALDYLVKPISIEELGRIVGQVQQKIIQKRLSAQMVLEHTMYGLLHDTTSEEFSADKEKVYYKGYLLVLDSDLGMGESVNLRKNCISSLQKWIEKTTAYSLTVGIITLDDGNIALVVSSCHEKEIQQCTESLFQYIQTLNALKNYCITIFSLQEAVYSLTDVVHHLSEGSKGVWTRIIYGLGSHHEIAISKEAPRYISLLEEHIRNREFEPHKAIHFFSVYEKDFIELWRSSELRNYIQCVSKQDFSHFNPFDAYRATVRWLETYRCSSSSSDITRKRVAEYAATYAQIHYTEEIGIAQIADTLGVSPNYLSSEFNRVVGESFPKYITKLRMERAVFLLDQQQLTIKEISALVGYGSSKHFGKVFKTYYGMAPSEYNSLREI